MMKKSVAAIALAVLAVFAVPAAANAAGYVPEGNITVTDATPAPGETVTVGFADASFTPGESVSFTLTGENAAGATLATIKAVVNSTSITKTAATDGAVSVAVTLPANATGSYALSGTGLTSGSVGTATLTAVAADAGTAAATGGLASTGYDAPMLAIWAAAGALLLGVALMVALTVVRRQRANA
ncbi:sortase [Cryobacterium sp. SO2]|uniref:sortase n=1 Tax=Cryobacterium sp. SO2 TaxID=1897060 RepID=UPI00223D0D2E|nr:sortase [Cryobacterium sp. SO2]WEO77992.1 sortase [Cryobacterium sp. SO2]